MGRFNLYAVFHLNLMYSAVEEDQRKAVVERCYWPLLRLISETKTPLAIESTGHTLELIEAIDPDWVNCLRDLCVSGLSEFVGSGYSQIIGPLVPADVNRFNQDNGMAVYDRLFGFRPRVALINEQAFSSGLIEHYRAAGYQAVIMEWNNPVRYHPEWMSSWRYGPQRVSTTGGDTLGLIWNDAISFQQFQRFAHGEISMAAYLEYLQRHRGEGDRCFPIYGGDGEVFDFRPGRYDHEAVLYGSGEWQRIRSLVETLKSRTGHRFILPSQILEFMGNPQCGQVLNLGSPEQPIPVKKQDKYNIVRWAVTGVDDLGANTMCWRLYDSLKRAGQNASEELWRWLCRLWSSDYRTHITPNRWRGFLHEMKKMAGRLEPFTGNQERIPKPAEFRSPFNPVGPKPEAPQDQFLDLETDSLLIRLNLRRGLAIDRLASRNHPDSPMVGTLAHGYFDDIGLGADYYSGHLIFEAPGRSKATDLNPAAYDIMETTAALHVRSRIDTAQGTVEKRFCLYRDQSRVDIHYRLNPDDFGSGSLRLGHLTLCPEAFERRRLFYMTHNGGYAMERHHLHDRQVAHGSTFSFLISATQALGMTEGRLIVGDDTRQVEVLVDKTAAALIGMMTYREIDGAFFCRVSLSAREMDETVRDIHGLGRLTTSDWISMSIILHDPPISS